MAKLWGGRFSAKTDRMVEYFTESISYDYQLYKYDILGSIAHAGGLKGAGVLSAAEYNKIVKGLREIATEIETGKLKFKTVYEDIHMNIEAALTVKLGDVAKKLHTGRSRNDQVATDVRLYLKEEVLSLIDLIKAFNALLVSMAQEAIDIIIPGYTHLQIAQPVLLSHHLLAYVEMFIRDTERLFDLLKRVDVMPLGAAALAGTTFAIDRKAVARELGFAKISENSMDAVSDRDFIVEFEAVASLLMLHLSRMSEELILWNSAEFGFVKLDDSYATGSSIMPQKKNPDIPELVRGKTGRVIGGLVSILTTIKGLPLTYNRDLQEDKELLFKTMQTVKGSLLVMNGLWSTIAFDQERMYESALRGYSVATDLADYLVTKKIPFRDAHEIVGKLVRYAIANNKILQDFTLPELKKFSKKIDKDVFSAISLEASINARDIYGGTATKQVKSALKRVKKRI